MRRIESHATAFLFFAQTLSLTLSSAFAQPDAAPIRAQPMAGPVDDPKRLCARLRKAACDEVRGSPIPHQRSTCKVADLPIKGTAELPFQAVQSITANCDNGDDLSKTRIAVKTQAGWFVSAALPDSGFQHHTNEQLEIGSLQAEEGAGVPLLALRSAYSCNQSSAGGEDDYMYSRTASRQLLLLIGIGSSGRPSAALHEVGSGLAVVGIPNSERVHREKTLWEDAVSQDFALLPGPSLRVEPPQVKRGAARKRGLPFDEPEPLCYDGSLSDRTAKAQRQVGSHPLLFR